MAIPRVRLKDVPPERLSHGHLWIFSNEISGILGAADPGSLVEVWSRQNQFLGIGFWNPRSLITVRFLTREQEPIDEKFWVKRVARAQSLRAAAYPKESSYRLIFGESDGFPGLVVDRYGDCLVMQSYCLGMDRLIPMIQPVLLELFHPKSIVLRNDSSIRTLEGLETGSSILYGENHFPLEITQSFGAKKLRFNVDPMAGQKSGFFFDQRENRQSVARWCDGKTVLDAYAYSGAFGIYAFANGAKKVTAIDSSEVACESARKNFTLNQVSGEVLETDVETALEKYKRANIQFDVVVLDPPALAKTKKNIFGALRKYQTINEQALALIPVGGILATSSCSHHVRREDFSRVLASAAISAKRQVRVLEWRGQALDHPQHPGMPETEYLKCAILRVD